MGMEKSIRGKNMSNYKLPKELKNKMERELRQYYYNKKKLDRLKATLLNNNISSRSLLYLEERLQYVENAYKRLKPYEQKVYDLIFKDCCDPLYCETNEGISKSTYYNIFNKSIYYLAEEWGEI
jgi:hypothetical protein